MVALTLPPTRNVVILGASYAGARAAELLSRTLPSTHRVVVIDRQSHFNHLYLHPRVSVVPGHAHKTFVPYAGVLPQESTPRSAGHVLIHASATSITDKYIELDRDLLEHERDLEGDSEEVEKLTEELQDARLDAVQSKKALAGRRISWDYMIYALGCTLPPPLYSLARTKKTGVAFLEAQQSIIANASSILIAGGGALGIQFATDIADLYNNPENAHHIPEALRPAKKKRITIVHSRDRFLPLYKQEVHDEVMKRMEELGVDVVLGERMSLPEDDKPGETKTVRTSIGKIIEYDLLMRCTGQKPNSQLMRDYLPETIDSHGFVKIRPTLQLDASDVSPKKFSEKLERIYTIGDVAAAGVIKAGHTGWNQAGVAVENIVSSLSAQSSFDMDNKGFKLTEYERSPPQIKVTLGLRHSVSELLPSMDAKETEVKKSDEGKIDGHYEVIWKNFGAETTDLHA
ncbi:NAD(P)/FAD-dependent oxidoreductase [Sporobolomyces salmoneus]|uniref:NAD(P)/FAD-dependent oxidoreductase n=1 Tax=Sporobolomyces salmoneus TaxID=183962 RepID=UPI00318290D5